MLPNTALQPLGQFGELAKWIRPCSVGRKAEGRVRWAAHESTGLTMKRAGRIARLKAAPPRSCGAARVLAHGHRSASPAASAGRFRRASPNGFGAAARLESVRQNSSV